MNTPVSRPLPDPLVELIAQRFKALADPTRVKLLDRLREGPATGKELTDATGSSQQNTSKHLGVLHAAGFVGREKHGTAVRYTCIDPSVYELCETVCGGLRRQLDALEDILAPMG